LLPSEPPVDPRRSRLTGIFAGLGVIFFALMFLATMLGVVARYLGVTGFEWSFEAAGMTFVWVTFLGVLVAELRGDNVAFAALRAMLQPSRRQLLDFFEELCLLAIGLALLASGLAVLRQSGLVPTPVLRWPGGVVCGSLVICGAALAAIASLRLRRRFGRSDCVA
jgi:TRAP-type C4-dicarboxylate transport system permease small subunit